MINMQWSWWRWYDDNDAKYAYEDMNETTNIGIAN